MKKKPILKGYVIKRLTSNGGRVKGAFVALLIPSLRLARRCFQKGDDEIIKVEVFPARDR